MLLELGNHFHATEHTVDNHGREHDEDDGVHADYTSIERRGGNSGYCGVDARFKIDTDINEDGSRD